MSEVVGAQLAEKLAEPIKFQWVGVGAQGPSVTVHGFDVTLLMVVRHFYFSSYRISNGCLFIHQ